MCLLVAQAHRWVGWVDKWQSGQVFGKEGMLRAKVATGVTDTVVWAQS